MSERIRKERQHNETERTGDVTPSEVKERTKEHQELLTHSEDLLADIDEALQGLDEDLVENFRQLNGE